MDIDKLDIDISQHVARALCVILDRKPRPSLDRVALRVAGGVGTWEATDGSELLTIRQRDQQPQPDGVWLLDRASVIRAGKMPAKWRTGQECRVTLARMDPPDRYGYTDWPDCARALAGYTVATDGPSRQGFDARLLALPSAVATALGEPAGKLSQWALEYTRGSTGPADLDPIRMTMQHADGLYVMLLIMPCLLD